MVWWSCGAVVRHLFLVQTRDKFVWFEIQMRSEKIIWIDKAAHNIAPPTQRSILSYVSKIGYTELVQWVSRLQCPYIYFNFNYFYHFPL